MDLYQSIRKLIKILTPLVLLLLIAATKVYLKPFKSPSSYTYFINPSAHLEHFTFGYKELVADLLWIRTIQDVDHCERDLKDKEPCSNSWVYRMVDKVTDLSPQFRIIYATVPLLLSIAINDLDGAILLLEKGLKYYPNDWKILYRGAYLYLFEKGDKVKAADYFLRAQKNGAPDWLATYATRLYTEAGRIELAQKLVDEYKEKGFPPGLLERMKSRLIEATKQQR